MRIYQRNGGILGAAAQEDSISVLPFFPLGFSFNTIKLCIYVYSISILQSLIFLQWTFRLCFEGNEHIKDFWPLMQRIPEQ